MKELLASLRTAAVSLLACAIVYPAAVLALAAVMRPESRTGSLVRDRQGNVVGSVLLAQRFSSPRYFWPRPSAVEYDAAAAGGSNLSPASPALRERAATWIGRLDSDGTAVPADLVTTSGSGLDPHVSLAAARWQIPRVAAARNLAPQEVESLVSRQVRDSAPRILGGMQIVNVLELNLALDALSNP